MPEPRLLVAVGSYTGDRGHGNGLTTYWLQDKGRGMSSQQRIAMDSPSYLAWHPDLAVLYAVQERAGGALTAFAADREGTLHRLGTLPTGGDDPCHVSISPDGRRAYCSNYTSGSLAVVELAPDGAPRERVALVQHHGSGHDPQRQESPHVHMAVTADDGRVEVVDLGLDRVFSYDCGRWAEPLAITKFPPGSGPRQLVHDGDATYVLGELSSAVYRLSGPRDALRVHDQVSATSATVPSFPAQLHLDAASRLLLVTNRGADTVAIFSADDFTRVAEIDCGGRTPRHLAQDGGLFFVSNQDSDEVCVFAMDDASRQLALVATHSVRSPSCVVTRGFAG